MTLLLKFVGALGIVGLIVLVLLIAVIWFFVKKRLVGFLTKALIAASPPRLHLVRELSPVWDDHDEVTERVSALRALGFRALGTYGCQELDQFQLVAMAHPKEGYAAAVFEHPERGLWVDLAAQFRDSGEYLVVSGADIKGKLPKIPGFLKVVDKKASVEKLFQKFTKKAGHHLISPVTPDNYVSFFETYYEAEMQGYYDVLGIEPDAPISALETIERDPELDQANAPLFGAVQSRDLSRLQQALQGLAGQSLEGRDEDGKTPLMAAVLTGDPAFVQPLLDAGADVRATVPGNPDHPFYRPKSIQEMAEEQDPDAQAAMATVGRVFSALGASTLDANETLTPLILAIWTGSEPVASLLIQAGAPLIADENPQPLHYATEMGDIHMVNLLLRSGVELELRDEDGNTPLMTAVRAEDVELVQWLLEAGADVDEKDEDGDTALTLAGYEGAEDLFEVLVPRAKKNIRKARKQLASNADPERNVVGARLWRAARFGKVARLQRLLGQGIPADSVEYEDGSSPLSAAAGSGYIRCVRLLLDAGANPNFQTSDGRSPLAEIAQSPDMDPRYLPDLVQMLIDAGASLDALDGEDRAQIVKVLQSRGGVLPA